jgi:hypothetical protein
MEEAAEQVASVYNALIILPQDGRLGRRRHCCVALAQGTL